MNASSDADSLLRFHVAMQKVNAATLLQLATHSAGFQKPVDGALDVQPGTIWRYSDAGLTWLADVLTQVNQRDILLLLHERVWSRIGISGPGTDDVDWRVPTVRGATLDGIPRRELHSGITINANSMARVGLLFLRRGVWANGERLLSEEFVDMVQTPRPETAALTNPDEAAFPRATEHFGLLW